MASAVFKKTTNVANDKISNQVNNHVSDKPKSYEAGNCSSSVSNTDQLDTTVESTTSIQDQELDPKEEKDFSTKRPDIVKHIESLLDESHKPDPNWNALGRSK